MEMKDILNYLFGGSILTSAVAKEILTRIGNGEFSEAETASFLTVFRMRKITAQELAGFREAMLGLCVPVNVDGMHTIDLCGTGGDGKNTFNISTLSSFVLAGAGVKVLKHGNYGASSVCGSSNIFEHYGYKLSNNNDKLLKELLKSNQSDLQSLYVALENNDLSTIKDLAHKIKGAARIIDAQKLMSACEMLENASHQQLNAYVEAVSQAIASLEAEVISYTQTASK